MSKTTELNNEAVESVVEEVKPYKFRKLTTQDLFPMLKLLNKIGFKDLKENEGLRKIIFAFSGGTVKDKNTIDVNALGMDMFLEIACLIVENVPKCEAELYTLLAQTSDLSIEQIQKQGMDVTFSMIIDFIKKEEFSDFFKVALRLFK
jgi:hypothetical protein